MTDKELTDTNFELEQDIMKCWAVVDDMQNICQDLEAGVMTQDEAVRGLRAFADVYQLRFDRTFRRYEQVCHGLHELRHAVKSFESAQTTSPKSGKMSKSKKAKQVDN